MPTRENLVHQTTTGTGTGNLTLALFNGKQSFNTAFGNGATTNVFDYFISNRDAAEYERGTGHMSDATTLVRDTVIQSTNANAAVNFSAGTKDVTNDIPAAKQARIDEAQTWSAQQTFSAAINLTSGQIVFPGTKNASAGANTLDDYEEGTWTPALNGYTVVGATTLSGAYTLIGNMVFWSFTISAATSLASTAGTSYVSGFSFAPAVGGAFSINNNAAEGFVSGLCNGTPIMLTPTWAASAWTFYGSGQFRL